jgi:hypothetical protein
MLAFWSALLLVQGTPVDLFTVRADLQGLYDEISQATLQFESAHDVDQFHEVLYMPDWQFVDAKGIKHQWSELRGDAIKAIDPRPVDSMMQTIQKLSLAGDSATAIVTLMTVRTIVDSDGRYGAKGATHTLTETTQYRDVWISVDGGWKMKSRQQVGEPRTLVDKSPYTS